MVGEEKEEQAGQPVGVLCLYPSFLERKCILARETFVTRDGQAGAQSLQQI